MKGKKNDQDLYEKVDYSMVPLDLIECYIVDNQRNSVIQLTPEFNFFHDIHNILNGKLDIERVHTMVHETINHYGIKPLAVSLGVGFTKYKERDNWMKFDNDPDRFLRAALRHLMAIMLGNDYDYEEGIEGYDKGNDHRGAVCFCLMVADNILQVNRLKEQP